MFCASEVVCKINILHEQYHSADRLVGNSSMSDIHVIICCALRVDSTCCCLALHTIWNTFTYFCVTLACHSWTRWVASLVSMYACGTVGRKRQTLKDPERISEAYLFKIRCLFLMFMGEMSPVILYIYIHIYLLRSLTLAAFCFSICNHFGHRRNVITVCLEEKQTNRWVVFFALKQTFSVKKLIVVKSGNWPITVYCRTEM